MILAFRHYIAARLLAAASFLTICFIALNLHRSSAWAASHILPNPLMKQTPAPASAAPTPSQKTTTTTTLATSLKSTAVAALPEKLWYKLGPAGLKDELKPYVDSCVSKNPSFKVEFLTDESGDDFVKRHFASSRPDMVAKFLAITVPIIKADVLRYLILYEFGGVWNDLDVSCEAPVSEWVPEQYKDKASIVVGMEFDIDIWIRQFASWTIMAKPKSPHMLVAVEDCLEGLVAKAKERKVGGIQDLKLDMIDDIVDVSGPRRLTRGILKSLSSMLNERVGDDEIANVKEPRLLGDVLVLPDYAFADTMNQQHGDKKPGRKLVVHHYSGSWKNANGGEQASKG
ncbi:hypothetical protein PspLS_10097 [Pyricularia sp. CBS 133598]|nr:hypothetical protein PspLS_10097 [Pyricularia sp. CBS 133598]